MKHGVFSVAVQLPIEPSTGNAGNIDAISAASAKKRTQLEISWLNDTAPLNADHMFVTSETCHVPILLLNAVACKHNVA